MYLFFSNEVVFKKNSTIEKNNRIHIDPRLFGVLRAGVIAFSLTSMVGVAYRGVPVA